MTGRWRLIFHDDFSEPSLNQKLWSTGWLADGVTAPVDPNEEQACYDPTQVSVAGSLLLSATSRSCAVGRLAYPYRSGMINTRGKFAFRYGVIAARIWLPADSRGAIADWPAFWAVGERWPYDGEIDVIEGLSGKGCWHFHSPAGGPGGCLRRQVAAGWHTYAAYWQRGSVSYYIDGHKVGLISSGVTDAPMYLVLNLAVSKKFGGVTVVPATMRVAFVRVWQQVSAS